MVERDAETQTQTEVQEDAAASGDDPVTSREATEQDLMAKGASDAGEQLGDQMA